jgi:hypothetical protein
VVGGRRIDAVTREFNPIQRQLPLAADVPGKRDSRAVGKRLTLAAHFDRHR